MIIVKSYVFFVYPYLHVGIRLDLLIRKVTSCVVCIPGSSESVKIIYLMYFINYLFLKENKINVLARKMEKQFAERAVKKPAGGVSVLPERNDEVQDLTVR